MLLFILKKGILLLILKNDMMVFYLGVDKKHVFLFQYEACSSIQFVYLMLLTVSGIYYMLGLFNVPKSTSSIVLAFSNDS
jgi:hypothetical protein